MKVIVSFMAVLLLLEGNYAMAESDYRNFVCVHEKDHLPLLDAEADVWYKEALSLTKRQYEIRGSVRQDILALYHKAAARDHWKAMHNLAGLYRTGWPGALDKDPQKALDLYERMVQLGIPQGFYDMGAMIGNRNGVTNPETDGLTYLDKAAQLGNPAAQLRLGQIYIYELKEDGLGLKYVNCSAEQNYAEAYYELGMYYNIKGNFPLAVRNHQMAVSLGHGTSAMILEGAFDKRTPPHLAFYYAPDEKLKELYGRINAQLEADPDLRFPNLLKDHPLPPHPTQGYDADKPIDWKPDELK
ncbi:MULTISPECIES: tetratricopeptide repeat protein [unclassified Pseudomonas]|uniref:tetratricopeptide repeat protein n=1 Tax=unclassified Pseudomonas TaxID=196821 RepID=UPI0012697D1D|nr:MULTISPECIES: tetratricopeptide repeat protein [unclassified Pseudomonas]WFC60451.1 sel1 repeat family protein [Pseudomonas sp. REST10]